MTLRIRMELPASPDAYAAAVEVEWADVAGEAPSEDLVQTVIGMMLRASAGPDPAIALGRLPSTEESWASVQSASPGELLGLALSAKVVVRVNDSPIDTPWSLCGPAGEVITPGSRVTMRQGAWYRVEEAR